jgi:hypothetical protein
MAFPEHEETGIPLSAVDSMLVLLIHVDRSGVFGKMGEPRLLLPEHLAHPLHAEYTGAAAAGDAADEAPRAAPPAPSPAGKAPSPTRALGADETDALLRALFARYAAPAAGGGGGGERQMPAGKFFKLASDMRLVDLRVTKARAPGPLAVRAMRAFRRCRRIPVAGGGGEGGGGGD